MNEQTRKPSSGTHMIDRNVLREDASPVSVFDGLSASGEPVKPPPPFSMPETLCASSSVSCVHFSIPNNRGRTDPVMARTPSAATANGSDKSETIQATADELAHAMAP